VNFQGFTSVFNIKWSLPFIYGSTETFSYRDFCRQKRFAGGFRCINLCKKVNAYVPSFFATLDVVGQERA